MGDVYLDFTLCVTGPAHHVALHATHGFSGLKSLISFLPGQVKFQPLPKDMGSAQKFAELTNETMDK